MMTYVARPDTSIRGTCVTSSSVSTPPAERWSMTRDGEMMPSHVQLMPRTDCEAVGRTSSVIVARPPGLTVIGRIAVTRIEGREAVELTVSPVGDAME